jgi:CheY-like chemotaxis protein
MAKILIIEDDDSISKIYKMALSFAGYEIDIATDGEEGIIKAKALHPSLILLDIMMPRMNGFEVLDRLKLDQDVSSIPIIVLSNLSGEKDEEIALQKGALAYLVKSNYEPNQIIDKIKEFLQNEKI